MSKCVLVRLTRTFRRGFTTKATHVPLYRLLSKLGLATREQGKVLVSSGKVRVNDRLVLDPEWWAPRQSVITVERASNLITFDGTMRWPPPTCLLMMHKKRGIVVAREDAKNKVVCDHPAIKNRFPSCLPVGRLDRSSEGLLLFTNDTQLAHRILSPQSHLVKTYHVRIDRPLASEELAALGTDVDLGGELTLPSTWTSMADQRNPNWVSVQLREGKHRQIRRMLAELGNISCTSWPCVTCTMPYDNSYYIAL
jgi:23S rRNA pseudouridine2605 synthase